MCICSSAFLYIFSLSTIKASKSNIYTRGYNLKENLGMCTNRLLPRIVSIDIHTTNVLNMNVGVFGISFLFYSHYLIEQYKRFIGKIFNIVCVSTYQISYMHFDTCYDKFLSNHVPISFLSLF